MSDSLLKLNAYNGKAKFRMSVGEAILSPTRQWAIVIKMLIDRLKEKNILHLLHGISMNTGGGATKIRHIGKGVLYKKIMPSVPSIFELIQRESNETWRNMFETFNCGIGIDVVGADNEEFKKTIEQVGKESGIRHYNLGVCEKANGDSNKIVLETPYGRFDNY